MTFRLEDMAGRWRARRPPASSRGGSDLLAQVGPLATVVGSAAAFLVQPAHVASRGAAVGKVRGM